MVALGLGLLSAGDRWTRARRPTWISLRPLGGTVQVVAHRPKQTSVWLWIQAESVETGWSLTVQADDGTTLTWSPDSETPHLLPNVLPGVPPTRVWFHHLTGLTPSTDHDVHFVTDGRESTPAAATFRTLPSDLDAPFTVLLGSCYSEDRDVQGPPGSTILTAPNASPLARVLQNIVLTVRRAVVTVRSALATGEPPLEPKGVVSRRYQELVASPDEPDVKFLVGDQVYLDAPFYKVLLPMTRARIQRHISRSYSRSWDKLGWMLAHGGNYFSSDDHEFWNNYPNVPFWPSLWSQSARQAWKDQAREFLTWVQDPQPVETFTIGNGPTGLSFFIADTRMNRTAGSNDASAKFMSDEDLSRLVDWVQSLRSPGVLVLGQPLLASAAGAAVDATLPAYGEQYRKLCSALVQAPHDVLVLSGDVHYGRIARVSLPRKAGGPRTLAEVVSSPMAVVLGAPGYYPTPFPEDMQTFPPAEVGEPAPVTYTNPLPDNGHNPAQDHFTTLRFAAREDRSGIDVQVKAHLIRSSGRTETLQLELH